MYVHLEIVFSVSSVNVFLQINDIKLYKIICTLPIIAYQVETHKR